MSIRPIGSRKFNVTLDGRRHSVFEYTYEMFSPKLPAALDGLKVLHLSDLHFAEFGAENTELAALCKAARPDIICFTGDAFSREDSFDGVMSKLPLMKALSLTAPTFFTRGNHENDSPHLAEPFEEKLRSLGIHVLDNSRVTFSAKGKTLCISGLVLPRECYRLPNGSYCGVKKVTPELLTSLLERPDGRHFELLMAHTPLPFHAYAAWGADLILSGHIHGGIIRVGGVGLLSPERKFFPRYTKHLYRIKTPHGMSCMEVSAGLGKFRINNPPSYSVCILRSKDNDRI